jgi:hypothetical protein
MHLLSLLVHCLDFIKGLLPSILPNGNVYCPCSKFA